jgi:hypothetical protein
MRESITIGSVGAGGDGVVVMGSLLQKLAKTLEAESVVKPTERSFFEKVRDAIGETLGS